MSEVNFDITDLERWQKQGIITGQQLDAIVKQEKIETKPAVEDKKSGLNLVTVLYYFGGFLALLSFTLFIGMSWEDLSEWGRFGISLAAILIIGGLGLWLRSAQKNQVAGGLLLFVATAIFPLLIYTVSGLIGVWPEGASFYELRFIILSMSILSLGASAIVLFYTRFPLITLLIAGFTHITLIDIVQMIAGESFPAAEATSVICSGLILLGIWITFKGMKSYAFWFKLYGLIGLQIAFSILFFDNESILFGLFFLAVYLVMMWLSIYLREAMFLVFSIISIYFYIFRLVFDIFENTVYFPLILGIIGVSIVLLGVMFQKYGKKLFRRKTAEQNTGNPPESD